MLAIAAEQEACSEEPRHVAEVSPLADISADIRRDSGPQTLQSQMLAGSYARNRR